jgi:hypothetical protein
LALRASPRARDASNLDPQIAKIKLYRNGKRLSREKFWLDDGSDAVLFLA